VDTEIKGEMCCILNLPNLCRFFLRVWSPISQKRQSNRRRIRSQSRRMAMDGCDIP
jgi:hypothetical protein